MAPCHETLGFYSHSFGIYQAFILNLWDFSTFCKENEEIPLLNFPILFWESPWEVCSNPDDEFENHPGWILAVRSKEILVFLEKLENYSLWDRVKDLS